MGIHFSLTFVLSIISAAEAATSFTFTMIPDQDETVKQARADAVVGYLSSYLQVNCGASDVNISFVESPDYETAVDALLSSAASLGWYGGLTGVQAALKDPGSVYLVQRLEDQQFTSVFVQAPGENITSLAGVEGKSLAYGSNESTSGHLMPAYFLKVAGVMPASVAFTGSHDNTVDAVAAGEYEVGALNSVVWNRRVETNATNGATLFYTTPEYVDYLWVASSTLQEMWQTSDGATMDGCEDIYVLLEDAFLAANSDEPLGAALLSSYSTEQFVTVPDDEYEPIEITGCDLGLIEAQYCPRLPSAPNGTETPPASDVLAPQAVAGTGLALLTIGSMLLY